MPGGTTFICSSCGKEHSFGRGFMEYSPREGEFVALMHPGEDEQLTKMGVDSEIALGEGKLWLLDKWGCRRCGSVFDHRRRRVPRTRMNVSWLFAVALLSSLPLMCIGNLWVPFEGMSEWVWLGWRAVISLAIWAIAVGAWWGVHKIDLKRTASVYAKIVSPERPERCPDCGSREIMDASDTNEDGKTSPLACSACGKRMLEFRGGWIS